ncbi:MAG: phosphate acetyltransferase [Eubacteriales bacterium]|nr:phosphate acetyltransferase [Eubacteriales bacterium]
MTMEESLREKAKQNKKTIVLAEGTDERIVEAAAKATAQGIADIILIGAEDKIRAVAAAKGVDLTGVRICDPAVSELLPKMAETFYELRKAKGVTPEQAAVTVRDEVYFATMLIKLGMADGMVCGAVHTTGDTLRPALQIIKAAPGIKTVSSCFLMEVPNCELGDKGRFVFADCGLVPYPNSDELAEIAVSAAKSARTLIGIETPKVAMLSYSTKGSAKHENVNKVIEATAKAHALAPDLILDGEMQADAAIVAKVGASKAPGSCLHGDANVLIFPDLACGNISYKLVQRLAKATALGPIMQGLARPVNDLSRGCSAEDVVSVVAITAVQAQG